MEKAKKNQLAFVFCAVLTVCFWGSIILGGCEGAQSVRYQKEHQRVDDTLFDLGRMHGVELRREITVHWYSHSFYRVQMVRRSDLEPETKWLHFENGVLQ